VFVVVVVFVALSLLPPAMALPVPARPLPPPPAPRRTSGCRLSTCSRRWTPPRPWITPAAPGSKMASSTVLPPNFTRACSPRRPPPSPRRNERPFVWRLRRGTTASPVAGLAAVSAWKVPLASPPAPPLLLPPPTHPKSIVPFALIPPSTSQKPRCIFSNPLTPFPAFAFIVSRVCGAMFTNAHPKPPSSPPHSFLVSSLTPTKLTFSFVGGHSLHGCPALHDVVLGSAPPQGCIIRLRSFFGSPTEHKTIPLPNALAVHSEYHLAQFGSSSGSHHMG